jgi:acetyltransferase-like isoleucine patch superfamily enzyme
MFQKINFILQKIVSLLVGFEMKFKRNLMLNASVKFLNRPSILIHPKAAIIINENCTINSSNYGYHLNMYNRTKLYADRENAIIEIGKNSRINGACIHAFNKIIIGENCLIAANTQIIDANGHEQMMQSPEKRIHSSDKGKEINIHNNVWIGANCFILGGTTIGEGSIITAGSTVRGTVPPRCIYGGNPGLVLKQY